MSQQPTETIRESEEQLIAKAQEAVSQCRWVVGECAAKWTQRYSRGRTDADFASLIGLTADQVYQRRRVWETFATVRDQFPTLKWSHFCAALTWDDATDCLKWAVDMQSTVAEMRAWRRAQRGEDLTTEALPDEAIRYLPTEPELVLAPFEGSGPSGQGGTRAGAEARDPAAAGFARQSGAGDENYAPYRADAGSTPPPGGHTERPAAAPLTTEQLAKRLAANFERCAKVLSAEFCREFRKLPEDVQERFHAAANELESRLAKVK